MYTFIKRIDLDWEYPSSDGINHGNEGNISSTKDCDNFGEILKELRARLSSEFEDHIEITSCVSADPAKIQTLPIETMTETLDSINLMTYDFASSAWGPCLAGILILIYYRSPLESVFDILRTFISR